MEIVKNSIVYRAFARLFAALARAWNHSTIAGHGSGVLHDAWQQSRAKRLWDGFCSADDPAKQSLIARLLMRIAAFLGKAEPAVSSSLAGRIAEGSHLHRLFLLLFALYLPIEYVLRDMLASSLASAWEELFLCAGLFFILWRTFLKKDGFARVSSVGVFLLLYMVVGAFLMFFNSPFPAIAFAGYRAQCEYLLWFFIIIRLIEDRADARFLVWSFAAVVFLLSLHGIYQFIIGVPIPASWVSVNEMGVRTRVFSLTGSPNVFGSLLVMAAPSLAAMVYYFEKPWQKLLALCGLGSVLLALIFTFSRAAWGGLAVAVLIFAMFVDKRLIAAMGIGIGAIILFVPSIANRLAYMFTTEFSNAQASGGRVERWAKGLELLEDSSKAFGFGLGRFGGAVAMNNQILDKTEDFSYFYLDNYYLKTLVEMGYVGLFAFILALVCLVIWSLRAIWREGLGLAPDRTRDALLRQTGSDRLIAVGVLAGQCGVLMHCYYENIFEEPYMMAYFWGLAAVTIYLGFFAPRQAR